MNNEKTLRLFNVINCKINNYEKIKIKWCRYLTDGHLIVKYNRCSFGSFIVRYEDEIIQ